MLGGPALLGGHLEVVLVELGLKIPSQEQTFITLVVAVEALTAALPEQGALVVVARAQTMW